MNTELRRSPRYADFPPISVSVQRNDNNSCVVGPFSARIVDLSRHGACLMLTQVMMQSFHIFHTTRDDDHFDLAIHLKIPSKPETIEILAQPIWLNATKLEDIKVFKMGVDFINTVDEELLQTINRVIKKT